MEYIEHHGREESDYHFGEWQRGRRVHGRLRVVRLRRDCLRCLGRLGPSVSRDYDPGLTRLDGPSPLVLPDGWQLTLSHKSSWRFALWIERLSRWPEPGRSKGRG